MRKPDENLILQELNELRRKNAELKAIVEKMGSEKKTVEKELLKLSRAVEQSPVSVIITDLDSNIVYANPKALSITGYSKDELIGKNPRMLNSGEKPKSEYKKLWETISSGKEWFGEFHNKKKNGELYWEAASISPIFNNKHEIINYVAVKEDITERKKFIDDLKVVKERAEENEEKFRNLYESLSISFLILKDGVCIECNEATLPIYGIDSKDEIIGKIPPDFSPEFQPNNKKSSEEAKRHIQAAIEKGVHTFEWITKRKNEEEFYSEVSLKSFYHKNEMYLQSLISDISERKKNEAELIAAKELSAENELFLSTLINTLPDLVWLKDINGVYLMCNKRFEEFIGASVNEIIGKTDYDFMSTDLADFFRQKDTEAINAGKSVINEEPITFASDKHSEYLETIKTPFYRDGRLLGVLGIGRNIIKRKIAELELLNAKEKVEENEIKFRQLAENLNDVVWLRKGEDIIYINPAFEQMFGLPREVLYENSELFFEVIHPEDIQKYQEALHSKEFANTKKFYCEYRIIQPNNEVRWIISKSSPIIDSKGNQTAFRVGIAVDITRLKVIESELIAAKERAEENERSLLTKNQEYESINEELRQANDELTETKEKVEASESKFRNLYESLSIAYFIIKDGVCIDCNKAALDIYGIQDKEEIIGKSPTEFSPEYQPNNVRSLDEAVRHTEIALKNGYHTFEWVAMRKNKELFYNEVSLKKFYYKNELHMQCLTTDITERKRIENDLIAEKEKAEDNERKLLEANEIAKFGSWELDIETETFTITDSFYKIFQTTASEMGGYQMSMENYAKQFVHPEDASMVTEEIKKSVEMLDSNFSHYIEHRILYKNGKHGYIGVWFYIVKNEFGKIIKTYGINQDITERKIAELELIHAKEKAEESDRLKSAFLANMSHEIRTPMNGILGFTDLLLDPDLNSKEKENYINIVHKSGQRMLNTVNDIIEISRIEAGLVEHRYEVTDFNNRIEDLVKFFTPEANRKGLKIFLEKLLPVERKNLFTDQNKLDSILTNLIKNAIKYTPEGTISIGCQLKETDIEFYISDTGIGVPKHRQVAIFNRFEQADIEDKRVFEGSGLGLAIAKSYVEMLGGKIWVESEEGKGSTFYFTLPVVNKTEEKSTNDDKILSDNKNANSNPKKLKIIIAEDDKPSRKYLSLLINDFCMEIMETETGNSTVEICRSNPDIDLILMDIQMPGMSGYEATRQIREFNRDVIIIAQTAFALAGDKEKTIDAGCNDYISKPIDRTKLENLLQKYFG